MIPKILIVSDLENTSEIIEQYAVQNAIPPSHRIILRPNTDELTLEQIHQMQQAIQVAFARVVLVVLIGVDNSSSEVQNSLLKCLEEDSDRISFLLLIQNPVRLLPTIISRSSLLESNPIVSQAKKGVGILSNYFSFERNSEATKESAITQIDNYLQSNLNINLVLTKHVLTIRKLISDNNMNPTAALDSILIFITKHSTMNSSQHGK